MHRARIRCRNNRLHCPGRIGFGPTMTDCHTGALERADAPERADPTTCASVSIRAGAPEHAGAPERAEAPARASASTRTGAPTRAKSSVPAYRDIYHRVRSEILTARLAARARLPSSRTLANQLGVARGTVELAYQILAGEGYTLSDGARGTIVNPSLPSGHKTAVFASSVRKPSAQAQSGRCGR